MKYAAAIIAAAIIQGCTMGAEVADEDKDKLMLCVDTRDGEEFTVNTSDIYKAGAGIAGAESYVKFKTTDGRDMTVTSGMTWLKCSEVVK